MTTHVQASFDVLAGLQNSLEDTDIQAVPPINLKEFVAFQDRNSSRRSYRLDKDELTALGSQMRRMQHKCRKKYRAKMR